MIAWITLANLTVFGPFVGGFIRGPNQVTLLDFPLGYFLAAQGSLLALVILSFWFAYFQHKIDREFGLLDDE